jgi:hypothetical protein
VLRQFSGLYRRGIAGTSITEFTTFPAKFKSRWLVFVSLGFSLTICEAVELPEMS